MTTVTSLSLLPAQGKGPNVYVTSGTVCSWATTLDGVDGIVSTCQAPLPPSLPPPPDLSLIPATLSSNIPTAITFVGNALTDGATCVFLPSGDATCAGAAARRLFPTGGVLSSRSLTVSLGGPMFYKLCVAPAGLPATLDAHFTYVSSAQLTVTFSPTLASPPPPSP